MKYPDNGLGRRVPVLNKQANAVLSREPILRSAFHDFDTGFKSLAIEVELEQSHFSSCTSPSECVPGNANSATSTTWSKVATSRVWWRATSIPSPAFGDAHVPTRNRSQERQRAAPTFPSWAPCRELILSATTLHHPIRFKIPACAPDHLPLMFDFEPPDTPAAAADGTH